MSAEVTQRTIFKISEKFSATPGPRYITEGDWSGELLRTTILKRVVMEAISSGEKITIDLDGTAGFGTSFLEEVFGGLIREDKLRISDLQKVLYFKSNEEPYLIDDIKEYMEEANDKN